MEKEAKQNPEEILAEKIDGLHRRRERKQFLLGCFLLILAFYVIFRYVIGIAFVNDSSMEPTLTQGELVVYYRLDRDYGNDDIVVVRRGDARREVKRIAACGGEEADFPYEVPAGKYFLQGDN